MYVSPLERAHPLTDMMVLDLEDVLKIALNSLAATEEGEGRSEAEIANLEDELSRVEA